MNYENYPNHKTYLSVASTNNCLITTPQMKNEPVLTLAEIINEIHTIQNKIENLENVQVYEVIIWYNQREDREFYPLPQNKIPYSFTVEVQKLINDSIKQHNIKLLNLFQLLNQQK